MATPFITGGLGLLGTELRKYFPYAHAPTRAEMDIVKKPWAFGNVIVHCAAFTDVARAEQDRDACYLANVIGTRNMAELGLPMIYISTEYVFSGKEGYYREDDRPEPVNYYAMTKLLGEYESRRAPRSLVVRLLIKPRPFKHEHALVDQYTSGDYVDIIAPILAEVIRKFPKFKKHDTVHIGTGRKNIFDLARETRECKPIFRNQIRTELPYDTSLDCSYWEKIHGQD